MGSHVFPESEPSLETPGRSPANPILIGRTEAVSARGAKSAFRAPAREGRNDEPGRRLRPEPTAWTRLRGVAAEFRGGSHRRPLGRGFRAGRRADVVKHFLAFLFSGYNNGDRS
jgi:hypothetical protein